MTKKSYILIGGLLLLSGLCIVASQVGSLSFHPPLEHNPYFKETTENYPSRLKAAGNQLINAEGEPVLLHGVMVSDPAVLIKEDRFEPWLIEEIAGTGANVLRVPVHPERWEHDPDYLWRYLDSIAAWCGENGLYLIIDLHFIGNIETSQGNEMPNIKLHSKDFSTDFWRQVATYFKETPHVIFEIFNEPQGITATSWRVQAADLIAEIRNAGADQLVIVGGIEWSKNLSWVLEEPVVGENIAYASHIYPAHNRNSWNHWFGQVSEQYPVIVTEWGWMDEDLSGNQPYLIGTRQNYGEPFLAYLDEQNIGWVACWYDDEWQPAMFEKDFSDMKEFGKFVLSRLATSSN